MYMKERQRQEATVELLCSVVVVVKCEKYRPRLFVYKSRFEATRVQEAKL